MTDTNEKRRRRLLTYIEFARMDLEAGRALSRTFGTELEKWGNARINDIDRLNAIQLMKVVEDQGFHGDDRFIEVARRLERFRDGDRNDPDDRLVRGWWEGARKKSRWLLPDDMLNRTKGRPKKAVLKK